MADEQPSGLRERKKQRRRQALHEAALRLIEKQGLERTTVEQICEDVGVSPRTFFNYFPSKTAAALNLPEQIITPDAAERFRQAEGELMPAICELLADSMASGGLERVRLKRLISDQPELVAAFTQWMGALKEEFHHLVAERAGGAKPCGRPRRPAARTRPPSRASPAAALRRPRCRASARSRARPA